MIGRGEIVSRVREWGLRESVVEKDYALGWLLWGIASDPELAVRWAFKGGTCLKKCYLETYRFSEDLDFTVLPGSPLDQEAVASALRRVLARVGDASGIDFAARQPVVRARPNGQSIEGRVYYRGPLGAPEAASIKLDLSTTEIVARPTVLRAIAHPYPDGLPAPASVRCYSFEEVFAEKLRAMGERGRPRDLYDIVNLYWRGDLRAHGPEIRLVLEEKCQSKGVPVPTYASIASAATRADLETEWSNMLAHQLPALPPFESFWAEIPGLFGWLDGEPGAAPLATGPVDPEEDSAWSPPPTVWTWGHGFSLESVRFASANRLCVELGYRGRTRVIEPYSLRRTRAGYLLLHAIRADNRQHRSYRVDQITSVVVTTRPFRPVYRIEFAASGSLIAPPARGAVRSWANEHGPEPRFVVECPNCERRFRRKTRTTELRPHKDAEGYPCRARRGQFVDEVDW